MKDDTGLLVDVKTGATARIRPGRQSGLTPPVHARLVRAFEKECSVQTVAAACKVPVSTLHRWLAKGRAGHPDYVDFAQDVAAARNLHKSKWMENVERMAEGDSPHALRANLTLLARQFPDEWGDRDTVALDEHKAKRNEADFLKTLTPEELQLLKSINEKRLTSGGEE